MCSRLQGENAYHLVNFFLVLYLSVRDHLVVIDRPSHVCRHKTMTISQHQVLINTVSLALRFGTEISLCWFWQSLCGFPISRFTSKVGPFPRRRRRRISYNHVLVTDVIRVNGQFDRYSSSFGLIPSVASLCLGPCRPLL